MEPSTRPAARGARLSRWMRRTANRSGSIPSSRDREGPMAPGLLGPWLVLLDGRQGGAAVLRHGRLSSRRPRPQDRPADPRLRRRRCRRPATERRSADRPRSRSGHRPPCHAARRPGYRDCRRRPPRVSGARSKSNIKGFVRGFDATHRPAPVLIFHTVPKKGEFGYDTWGVVDGVSSANTPAIPALWAEAAADPTSSAWPIRPIESAHRRYLWRPPRPKDNLFMIAWSPSTSRPAPGSGITRPCITTSGTWIFQARRFCANITVAREDQSRRVHCPRASRVISMCSIASRASRSGRSRKTACAGGRRPRRVVFADPAHSQQTAGDGAELHR